MFSCWLIFSYWVIFSYWLLHEVALRPCEESVYVIIIKCFQEGRIIFRLYYFCRSLKDSSLISISFYSFLGSAPQCKKIINSWGQGDNNLWAASMTNDSFPIRWRKKWILVFISHHISIAYYLHKNNSDQKMRLYEVLPLCDSYFIATFFDAAVIQEFVIKSSIYDSYLYK